MNAPFDQGTAIAVPHVATWSERNQAWLASAFARLRERLTARKPSDVASRMPIADTLADAEEQDFTPALLRCSQIFGLTPFERELVLLLAGVELDRGMRDAISSLRNDPSARPSFGLVLDILTKPHWDALSPDATLRYWQLLELEPRNFITEAGLRLDERLIHFVAGVRATDPRLAGIAQLVEAVPGTADVELADRIVQALASETARTSIISLTSDPFDAARARELALAVAARYGKPALWVDGHTLPADPAELAMVTRHIDREAALNDALTTLMVPAAAEETCRRLAGQLRGDLVWLGAQVADLAGCPRRPRSLRFEIPATIALSVRQMLGVADPATALSEEETSILAALERAATQFRFGPSTLDAIATRLEQSPPSERPRVVWAAAREAARGSLDALAQRIVSATGFDDLVLPPAQIAAVRDIARQLRHRERVYRDWGFAGKHTRGQGLVALFAGESGTGKTLAAEAIANEVQLDLYRVDLASLVSKYIGETEKNLKRLFDAAEASGSVLLFDEADAIFGKRSEVKDSHDRYANIEVAYLLQRVEAYRGLAILTTNMKSALDRAFLRRIRFIVTFPFPDAAAREQIWRRQFPAAAPLGHIDFAALARLNLPGGNIHSIALNAAFKAADGSGVIDHPVIIAAARAEFAKLERSFNDPGGLP